MIAVKHTKGKAPKQDAHAKAVADLDRIERDLARAQNRWQKQRALVKRLEAKADKRWAARDLTPRAVHQHFDDELIGE